MAAATASARDPAEDLAIMASATVIGYPSLDELPDRAG
jgi:hypothetical protein